MRWIIAIMTMILVSVFVSAQSVVDVNMGRITTGNTIITSALQVNGAVNATTYYGDGSQLTGIIAGNLTFNQSLTDSLYAKYQFENNNFNGSGNFTTTGVAKLNGAADWDTTSALGVDGDVTMSLNSGNDVFFHGELDGASVFMGDYYFTSANNYVGVGQNFYSSGIYGVEINAPTGLYMYGYGGGVKAGITMDTDSLTINGQGAITDTYDDGTDTVIYFDQGIAYAISTAYDESLMQDIVYLADNIDDELTLINFRWNQQGLNQFKAIEDKSGIQTGYKVSDVLRFYPDCVINTTLKQFENVTKTKEIFDKIIEIDKKDAFETVTKNATKQINTTCYHNNLTTYKCTKVVDDISKSSINTVRLKSEVTFDKYTGIYEMKTYKNESFIVSQQMETNISVQTYNRNCVNNYLLNDRTTELNKIKDCAKLSEDFKAYKECVAKLIN